MKLKKIAATSILIGSMFAVQNAYAWKIVFDPTAVAQAVQQVYQLKQQYETMKNQLESVTGNYNVGAGLSTVQDIVPGSWQDVVKNQAGAFGSKQATYDKLMQVIDKSTLDSMMKDKKSFANNYNMVRMGMAVSDTSYEALNEHIKNLGMLSGKINTTKNIKEAQDLANQIAIEQSYITAINARLGAVQSNMLSVQANGGVSGAQKINVWNR